MNKLTVNVKSPIDIDSIEINQKIYDSMCVKYPDYKSLDSAQEIQDNYDMGFTTEIECLCQHIDNMMKTYNIESFTTNL